MMYQINSIYCVSPPTLTLITPHVRQILQFLDIFSFLFHLLFPPLFTPIVSMNTSNLPTPKSNIYYIPTFPNSNLNTPTLSLFLNQYYRKWYVSLSRFCIPCCPTFVLINIFPLPLHHSSLPPPVAIILSFFPLPTTQNLPTCVKSPLVLSLRFPSDSPYHNNSIPFCWVQPQK